MKKLFLSLTIIYLSFLISSVSFGAQKICKRVVPTKNKPVTQESVAELIKEELIETQVLDLHPSRFSSSQVLLYGALKRPFLVLRPGKTDERILGKSTVKRWKFAILSSDQDPMHPEHAIRIIHIWGVKNPNKKLSKKNIEHFYLYFERGEFYDLKVHNEEAIRRSTSDWRFGSGPTLYNHEYFEIKETPTGELKIVYTRDIMFTNGAIEYTFELKNEPTYFWGADAI